MPYSSSRPFFAAVVALAAGLFIIGTWGWLEKQASARDQIHLAETFVNFLRSQRVEEAYELTMKSRMDLPTKEDFAAFAPRQICGAFEFTEVFPLQTNGNRLRRWMSRQDIEMQEVNVQYMGDCAFRVTLRRDAENKWKVFKFGSHAW